MKPFVAPCGCRFVLEDDLHIYPCRDDCPTICAKLAKAFPGRPQLDLREMEAKLGREATKEEIDTLLSQENQQ